MGYKTKLIAIATLTCSLIVMAACGGGSDENTTPQATAAPTTAAGPTPNKAPAATTVATQPAPTGAAIPGFTGTALDTSTLAPYELDNIRYGGTEVFPTQFSNALDPKLNNSGISLDVRNNYEPLLGWKAVAGREYNQLYPLLAENWQVSADVKTYTFNLRKGIKWQNVAPTNGRELVASDAAFSMNRYREKDAVNYSSYQQVDSIEAPDKYTVVVRLKEPNAFALNELFSALDYVVPPELVANGEIFNRSVGTGPFIMKKWNLRSGSSHVRNPDYWQKDSKGNLLPYVDAMEVPFINDPGTSLAAFRSGQTDIPAVGPLLDQILSVSKSTPNVRVFWNGTNLTGQGFTFRVDKAPWSDVRVRRAINMMLDKPKYGDLIEGPGRWTYSGPMPWNLVSDKPFSFDELGPYYKYDPEAAKKLLIEAGYKDGKIKSPTPLVASQGNPYGPRTALFQTMFKENGFEFDQQAVDFATYNPYYFNRQAPDISLTHHILTQPNLNWYAQNKYSPNAAQNTGHLDDPEITKLLQQIRVTTDPAKQREYAKAIWDFDTLGSYNIWVPIARSYTVMGSRVRNYYVRQGGAGFLIFMWLADAPRTSP
ncbi:MAG: ABC transporter substrate-binding protein [Dehalococcoidia bacterium]|nr:ABC transporter substrate-binding protein [Dehalococcoidia bacterium]